MIDPVIHTFNIFGFEFSLRWYGVIVMLGVIVASLMIERVLKQHGENSETIWDALVWVLPIGIIGARLWYVINATLGGGDTRYANDPAEIIKVWHGGLHIFGGLLLGGAALLYYLNKNKLDTWLFLDAAGPAMLIGQGIGRIANFINQELYGPPTTMPWGIPISAEHRLADFASLPDTTRFHPTFAYEMIWNFATAGILLWLAKRYEKQIKPGTIFAGWLIAAGIGRTWLEFFFRPDQPKIGNSIISYTSIASALMAIAGAILLMARYKAIKIRLAENWEETYKISMQPSQLQPQAELVEIVEEPRAKTPRVKKVVKAKAKATTVKKVATVKKAAIVKKPVAKKAAPKKKPVTRKKSAE